MSALRPDMDFTALAEKTIRDCGRSVHLMDAPVIIVGSEIVECRSCFVNFVTAELAFRQKISCVEEMITQLTGTYLIAGAVFHALDLFPEGTIYLREVSISDRENGSILIRFGLLGA